MQNQTSKPGSVQRIYLSPVRPQEPDAAYSGVWAENAHGRSRQLTVSSLCTAPKVFRDGRTYGWLEGTVEPKWGYLPQKLLLFRDDALLCSVEAEKRIQVDWTFSKDGQYAVIRSMAAHGPTSFQRVDLLHRRVDATYAQRPNATADPAWVTEADQRIAANLDGNYRAATPVALPLAQRRQWNVVLSALAAAEMPPFSQGQLTDPGMVRFAVYHTYRTGGGLAVSAGAVDALCLRFFGKNVRKHQSVAAIRFDEKNYRWSGGDGEESSFALVEQAQLVAPGLYQVSASEYRATGETKRYLDTPRDRWSTLGGESPVPTRRMRCLVRKTNDATTGCIVLEYLPQSWR